MTTTQKPVTPMPHSAQMQVLLRRVHRPMYTACLREGNKKRAEEVRQFVMLHYGLDLATENA